MQGLPSSPLLGQGPLSDVEARQLVDWPHAPGRALCSHGNSPVLQAGPKPLVHEGAALPSPSPPPQPLPGVLGWVSSTERPACCRRELWGCPLKGAMSWAAGPSMGTGGEKAQAQLRVYLQW